MSTVVQGHPGTTLRRIICWMRGEGGEGGRRRMKVGLGRWRTGGGGALAAAAAPPGRSAGILDFQPQAPQLQLKQDTFSLGQQMDGFDNIETF